MSEEIPGLPGYELHDEGDVIWIAGPEHVSVARAFLNGDGTGTMRIVLANQQASERAAAALTAALRVLECTAPEFSESDVRAAWDEGYALRGLEATGEADDAPSFAEWLGQLRGWRQA